MGVAKVGVVKAHHAVVYSGTRAPKPSRDELAEEHADGMIEPPIRLIPELSNDKLDTMSRINFANTYTVAHDKKVYDFGEIHPDSLSHFTTHFNRLWNIVGSGPLSTDVASVSERLRSIPLYQDIKTRNASGLARIHDGSARDDATAPGEVETADGFHASDEQGKRTHIREKPTKPPETVDTSKDSDSAYFSHSNRAPGSSFHAQSTLPYRRERQSVAGLKDDYDRPDIPNWNDNIEDPDQIELGDAHRYLGILKVYILEKDIAGKDDLSDMLESLEQAITENHAVKKQLQSPQDDTSASSDLLDARRGDNSDDRDDRGGVDVVKNRARSPISLREPIEANSSEVIDAGVDESSAPAKVAVLDPGSVSSNESVRPEVNNLRSLETMSDNESDAEHEALKLAKTTSGESRSNVHTIYGSDSSSLEDPCEHSAATNIERLARQRLTNPDAWLERLETLEGQIAKGSSRSTLGVFGLHKESGTITDCRKDLDIVVKNLTILQKAQYCTDNICVPVVCADRPQVASLIRIDRDHIYGMGALVESMMMAENDAHIHGIVEHLIAFGKDMGFSQAFARDLQSLFVLPDRQKLVATLCSIVRFLDLTIISYAGAHLEPFDNKSMGDSSGFFDIGSNMRFRRRSLRCLSSYFKGHDIWVLEEHIEMGAPREALYLLTSLQTFATVWGPVRSAQGAIARVGRGVIIARDQTGDAPIHSGESLCHWMEEGEEEEEEEEEEADKEVEEVVNEENGLAHLEFSIDPFASLLLIGAGSRVGKRDQCLSDAVSFTTRRMDQKRLVPLGVSQSRRFRDSQTFTASVSAMGLNIGYQEQYKIRQGSSYRDAFIAAWQSDEGSSYVQTLKNWFGVEISYCTRNARKCRLTKILGSAAIKNHLDHGSFNWKSVIWENDYFAAMNSDDPRAFEKLYGFNQDRMEIYKNAIKRSLNALSNTGCDDRRCLRALWSPRNSSGWTIEHHYSEHRWNGLLADDTTSFAVAIISQDCLTLGGHSQCGNERSYQHSARLGALETAVVINEAPDAQRPEGLRKRPIRIGKPDISDVGISSRWSLRKIREGGCLDLGEKGRLRVRSVLKGSHGEQRSPALEVEWKERSLKGKFIQQIHTDLRTHGGTCTHRELVFDLPNKTEPIPVLVSSSG